jgi:hypothetical protein
LKTFKDFQTNHEIAREKKHTEKEKLAFKKQNGILFDFQYFTKNKLQLVILKLKLYYRLVN